MSGDVKNMQLLMSQDLLYIMLKKPKNITDPPKSKYIIESSSIKQVIKGHGTDAFKKSKGFFRSVPSPEKCFSIIGPTTIDGLRSFNIECENENEVDKWINSLEMVIVFLKKSKIIKNNVVIRKAK